MCQRLGFEVRPPVLALGVAFALSTSLLARAARCDNLSLESPYRIHESSPPRREPEWAAEGERKASLFRISVGPALLLEPSSPGLLGALDLGRGAVGARLSAALLRAESERGLAAYAAELWVDLGHRYQLHPVLGAGVSLLHGGALGRRGSSGAGVLRAGLDYELPIDEADARLGLNVIGLVPAIDSDRTRPWLLGSVTLGVGF